jgi:hypothetical protein
LNRQININSKNSKKEKEENLGILLSIGITGSEGKLLEGKQREKRSREFFW